MQSSCISLNKVLSRNKVFLFYKFQSLSSKASIFFQFNSFSEMGIRLPSLIVGAKRVLKRKLLAGKEPDVRKKGYIAVYVGKCQKKRFVVPVMYINHPSFGDLLNRAEAEFGFYHPMGGLTIACEEGAFIDLSSRLHAS